MSINKIRSVIYFVAKILGDINSIKKVKLDKELFVEQLEGPRANY